MIKAPVGIIIHLGARAWAFLLTAALWSCPSLAEEPPPGPYIDNETLFMLLRLQTPDQMSAFYEARGFPAAAIDVIAGTCFVTVHIDNKSQTVLWLDISQWTFQQDGETVARFKRDWWDDHWNRIDLSQAHRATFGWTQLPVLRDLQPAEPVGGNIALPRNGRPFDITARLQTGTDKRGKLIEAHFENISCAEDTE